MATMLEETKYIGIACRAASANSEGMETTLVGSTEL